MKRRVRPELAIDSSDQAFAKMNAGVHHVKNRVNEAPIKLPKIELPTFSGAYKKWHLFFSIFDSLIHSNNALNGIQKFHYLKSALKGEAAKTIESLEITKANYCDAWSHLKERYDNERIAVQNHIRAILELPALKRE